MALRRAVGINFRADKILAVYQLFLGHSTVMFPKPMPKPMPKQKKSKKFRAKNIIKHVISDLLLTDIIKNK